MKLTKNDTELLEGIADMVCLLNANVQVIDGMVENPFRALSKTVLRNAFYDYLVSGYVKALGDANIEVLWDGQGEVSMFHLFVVAKCVDWTPLDGEVRENLITWSVALKGLFPLIGDLVSNVPEDDVKRGFGKLVDVYGKDVMLRAIYNARDAEAERVSLDGVVHHALDLFEGSLEGR